MKTLMLWARIFPTFSFIFSFSATSNSATFATDSTRTRVPNTCKQPLCCERRWRGGGGGGRGNSRLDFVRVHGGVGDEDSGVLHARRLPHPRPFLQDEALVQEGVQEAPPRLLDHLHRLQVTAPLKKK